MPLITLTKLDLSVLPGANQTFWMNWSPASIPSDLHTLPDAHTDPLGNIISPLPYTFTVPHESIIVRARNMNKCEDWFEKTFEICELVPLEIDLTP